MSSPSHVIALSPNNNNNLQKLSILPLIFIIFYEVSGGPFGVDDIVRAAGPLLSLLGFLIFPLIWSIPEALITIEMGTMLPENGGYATWVLLGLNPCWGFLQGWVKWLCGVVDNAEYPALFLDYLKSVVPALSGGPPRVLAVVAITISLTYMNYRGLTIVGKFATILAMLFLLPFGSNFNPKIEAIKVDCSGY